MARFILGQLVMHVLRRDAWMKAWYGRIKRRRGAKIARVAVMRRLATILWHMVKYHEPYRPGGPAELRRAHGARRAGTLRSLRSGSTEGCRPFAFWSPRPREAALGVRAEATAKAEGAPGNPLEKCKRGTQRGADVVASALLP